MHPRPVVFENANSPSLMFDACGVEASVRRSLVVRVGAAAGRREVGDEAAPVRDVWCVTGQEDNCVHGLGYG